MSELLHGKRIVTESYYEGSVASVKQEIEVSLFSTKETVLKDVIEALSVISGGETRKLSLEVCIDSKDRYRLVKRWVVQ